MMRKILKLTSYILLTLFGLILMTIMVVGQKDIPKNEIKLKYTNQASKFMPIMGMQVHYRDEGNSQDSIPLVLIHGTSSSLHTWEKVTRILNEPMYGNKRVITLDMPAFGLTGPNPENKYSYENFTAVIDSLLINLKVNACMIGGNSLGGGIAWHYTVAHPNKVTKLILIDASGYPKKNEKGSLGFIIAQIPIINNLLLYITPKSLVQKSLEDVYYNKSLLEQSTVTRYHDFLLCAGNRKAALSLFKNKIAQNPELIKTIQTPTLILWGREDGLISVDNVPLFNQDIKNSEVVILDKVGHVPNEEAPKAVADAIYNFIK
jgi:pimeloyl-ACP methyl ester carboxylesterase